MMMRSTISSGMHSLDLGIIFGANSSRQNGHVWLMRAWVAKHSAHISCPHLRVVCPRPFISSIHMWHSTDIDIDIDIDIDTLRRDKNDLMLKVFKGVVRLYFV